MKRIVSVMLVMLMIASLLAGCGNTAGSASDAGQGAAAGAQENAQPAQTQAAVPVETQAAAPAETQAAAPAETQTAVPAEPEEVDEIVVRFVNPGGNLSDTERIINAINAMTEEKINVRADIEWIEIGAWNEQMNLAFAAAEPIDVITISPSMNLNSMVSASQLMDISPYIDEYGQEAAAAVSKLMPAVTIDGAVYGFPKLIQMEGSFGFMMNKDMLTDAGLMEQAEAAHTWDEMEALLLAVKEAYPDVTPLFVNAQSLLSIARPDTNLAANDFSENYSRYTLGDPFSLIYVDDTTNEVRCLYDDDDYREMVRRIARWYSEGLIYKDAAATQENQREMLNSGAAFAFASPGDGDPVSKVTALAAQVSNYQLYYKPVCDTLVSENVVTMWGFAVPYTSKNPEAAVKFINMMYSDPDLQNLLEWGEEGVDFVVKDGVAQFPEGKDISTVGYHAVSFLYGNSYIAYPWAPNAADFNQKCQEYYDNMGEIKYFGCSIDTSSVDVQATACYNDYLQYISTLASGADPNPDAVLDEFVAKLHADGIDDVIACYQEQLDTWLANQ